MTINVKPKIEKAIHWRYVVVVEVELKSPIQYFADLKCQDDIRLVYDTATSGLNGAVQAPSSWLHTIDSDVWALDEDTWMTDQDMGGMFLNFQIHELTWMFAGVDVWPVLGNNRKFSFDR